MDQLELHMGREEDELSQVRAAAALLLGVDENLVRDIEISDKGGEGGSFNGDSADSARRKSYSRTAEEVQGKTFQEEDKKESRREGLSKDHKDNVKYSSMNEFLWVVVCQSPSVGKALSLSNGNSTERTM